MSFKRDGDFVRMSAKLTDKSAALVLPAVLGDVLAESTEDRQVILVVDDDEAVRRVVRTVLTTHGYAVLEASDGQKALDLWASVGDYIDLVLTDINMPGMSGTDLALTLWAQGPGVPVIYMSGGSELGVVLEQIDKKRVGFLAKPFTMAVLMETVAKGLMCGSEVMNRAETKSVGR